MLLLGVGVMLNLSEFLHSALIFTDCFGSGKGPKFIETLVSGLAVFSGLNPFGRAS
jgi:hypothetical protein